MEVNQSSALKSVFKEHSHRPFVFVKPGGNWGDQIIYMGAEFLAESLGIKYRSEHYGEFDPATIKEDEVVYLHGGGGFNPWCSGNAASSLRDAIYSKSKVIIQGPQSFDDENDYVSSFFNSLDMDIASKKNVYIFVREHHSLELLGNIIPESMILKLDKDTALNLTREALLQRVGDIQPRYDLIALRIDNEAPSSMDGYSGKGIRLDPARYAGSFEQWIRIHAAAKSIVTNRTHSSVAGAILEIPTTLLAGSYHKNRSIWEASLKDRGVKWAEYESKVSSHEKSFWMNFVPGKIRNSWKVNHAINWLKGVP